MLTDPHIRRFSRHVLLREVGGVGQERLLAARVALPTLDTPTRACALWLARSGVGGFVLPVDYTLAVCPDPSGLLHAADDGRPLAEAVRERLLEHFPDLDFTGRPTHAAPAGGAEGALALVRTIVQGRPA